jgi:hypothetical protein
MNTHGVFFWLMRVPDRNPEQRESKETVLCPLGWFLPNAWLLGCVAGQPWAWVACHGPVAVTAALGRRLFALGVLLVAVRCGQWEVCG